MYSIYSLEKPLGPGETITLTCKVGHQTRGFRDGNEPAEFAYNGTFFDSDYVPTSATTTESSLMIRAAAANSTFRRSKRWRIAAIPLTP